MSAYGAEALVKAASSTATVTAIHLPSCGATNCFARPAMTMWREWLRQNNPTGKSAKSCPVLPTKIFRLTRRANQRYQLAPSHPIRGAGRDRHERCGEMRWTRSARKTSVRDADGEVVWSWRPGAGAKFAEAKLLQMTVARKPVTGESPK
jgi:hypothetical protein